MNEHPLHGGKGYINVEKGRLRCPARGTVGQDVCLASGSYVVQVHQIRTRSRNISNSELPHLTRCIQNTHWILEWYLEWWKC